MNNHEHISEELLARYLAETATEEEISKVENWKNQSPDNQHELAAYKTIWEQSAVLKQKKIAVDTDAAWNKVKLKMEKPGVDSSIFNDEEKVKKIDFTAKLVQKKFPATMWAAVALLIVAFGLYFVKTGMSAPESLQIATRHNNLEKTLPDGTKVFLNYNSTLIYPENFEGEIRSVALKGEAFFDVKPDASHPFVIDANGTEIKVLGTSFNVKAYAKEPVRVDVATGKVMVKKADNLKKLTKGQSAEVLDDTIKSIIPDVNIMGYRTQIFDFNAASLKDVVSSIRNGYHIDLRLSDKQTEQCKLTIRFEKEPVDATLFVIAETLQLKVRKEGKTYWLDGHGCK